MLLEHQVTRIYRLNQTLGLTIAIATVYRKNRDHAGNNDKRVD